MSAKANFFIVLGAVWAGLILLLGAALSWLIREEAARRAAGRREAHVAARRARRAALCSPQPAAQAAPDPPAALAPPEPSAAEGTGPIRRVPALPGYDLSATQMEPAQLLAPARDTAPPAGDLAETSPAAEEDDAE